MRVGITGARGQLGTELVRTFARRHEVIRLERPEFDVTNPDITDAIARLDCDLIVHAAAMTDVDGCARDPKQAHLVNTVGTQNVAMGCRISQSALVLVSTNEVFDGHKRSPYVEDDLPNPINPYGASKLAAEQHAATLVPSLYIVRTAWVFGPHGRNFVTKMLELAGQRDVIRVVEDEVAAPTYAPDLAEAIVRLSATGAYGTYHFTNSGICSRFEYARKIFELAGKAVRVEPMLLVEYVRDSTPPAYTPLANRAGRELGIQLRHWQDALAEYLRLLG